MKRVLKSCLSLVLALTIVLSSAYVGLGEIDFGGIFAVKAEAASESDLTFTLNDDGESNSVTACNESASGSLVIPSTYNGLPVTSIGGYAFDGCSSLTSITIPDSVTSIGDFAFEGCTSLTSVTIPASVTSIGVGSFAGFTGPTSINVDGNNTYYSSVNGVLFNKNKTVLIQYPAGKASTEYIIPDSVTSIGEYAFVFCTSLTSITIPDSVTSIGDFAFGECTSLTSITIPGSVTSIGDYAFVGCRGLTSITIPDKVTSIGEVAFAHCKSLTSITIPDSVTSICESAFYNCTSLTSVTIGNSVTSIGSSAFRECTSLTSVTIPDGVKSIGNEAFYGCTSLTSVTIGNSVTSIGDYAFVSCTSLTAITIHDGVTSIGWCAFGDCTNLTSINVDENNSNYSSFDGVLFNKDKTILIQYPVGKTNTEYSIPNSVTSICGYAFFGCSSLTSVTIGNSVTSIGGFAFYECTSLENVYYRGLLSDWDKIVIGYNNDYLINANISHRCTYGDWEVNVEPTCTGDGTRSRTCAVCGEVISETITATGHNYLVTNTLSSHSHTITYTCSYCGDERTEDSVSPTCIECNFTITEIDSTEYKLVSYIGTETEVLIPATYNERAITSIAVGCFKGNTEITSVEIGDGVTNIGSLTFMNCSSLERVIIPESVTSIGTQAFYGFTGTIYCVKGSYAYDFAVANGIKYEILGAEVSEEPIQDTKDTTVDYENSLIYTTVENCSDINEILGLSDSAIAIAEASYIYGNTEFYGTGTVITVFDGGEYVGEFTLVVSGDINGDSVCNVIDCAAVQVISSGHGTLAGVYAMAADSNSDGMVDAIDYQTIVNKALS